MNALTVRPVYGILRGASACVARAPLAGIRGRETAETETAGPITRAPRGGEDTRLLNSAKIYRFPLSSCPKRRLEPSLSAHGVSSRHSETDGGLTCLEFRLENKSRQPTRRPERSHRSRLIEVHSSQCITGVQVRPMMALFFVSTWENVFADHE